MSEHRFDGSVAIVTGAGRGIGRIYQAAGGAGRQRGRERPRRLDGGDGADTGPATTVADEIVAAGGVAIADTNDVSTTGGAEALIAATVEQFGRIDIVINNAGIIRWAGLPDADLYNLDRHLAVHVAGPFNTIRAVWPHMVDQGYDRSVNTTSSGVFGLTTNLFYARAKGGVIGMARSLATASADHGIKVQPHRFGGHDAHGWPAG